ncbi:COG0535 Predicted Fe-S oxidoreductases [uncultured Caudovirales phage]|uniref:COG0535 Predicted Fe-S oxidoreductases n=1 Tax=uncultured Caudovirales phage TaxID=2100421 RepID=A0A6J7WDH7_9CAUD|nr:COG0535 Predicted Fe-S oxidoreductases [uncultured Caudovirales phage]CAB5208788.1 COG0535 Predicted Fe-S oxidoreductases [uncultured Caudovirales phage]
MLVEIVKHLQKLLWNLKTMLKVSSRWHHQDSIKIEWNLGKRCNYDCTYCPSIIHDTTSPHTDIEILKASVDNLMTLGKPIRLSFTGGEPTVHPKFEELINYCKHVGISWISVTTNGTRKPEWYAKQRVDQWVFSIHFEYDWLRVLNTITTVTAMCRSSKYVINVMAHHDYMPEVKASVEKLKSYEIPHVVRRIRWTEGDHDLFDDMRYNLTDLEWIKSQQATVEPNVILWMDKDYAQIQQHANDVIKLHLNKFKGWSCNAGIESLMINWDGDVHRATCRVGGSLGNIYEGNFTVPTEPIICDRNFCTCASDIPLTKIKI